MAAISKSETWDRIGQAEMTGETTQVFMAIKDHVSSHNDESFYTVESRLRVEGRVTYVFAETREQRNSEGRIEADYFADIRTKAPCKYGIRVLMRSCPEHRPIIARFSVNPQENLEKLKKDTGIPTVDPQIVKLFQALFSPTK